MAKPNDDFCIICLGTNPLSDQNPLTKEHIVPEFMGGSLTFRRVCKTCNSSFGDGFEGRLSKQWLFMAFAHLENIEGKSSAKVPFRGDYTHPESGDKFRVNDDGSIKNQPKIEIVEDENGGFQLHFKIDPSDLPKAKGMIKTKLTRFFAEKKKSLPDEVLDKAYKSLNKHSNQIKVTPSPQIEQKIDVDFNDIEFLHLKIGYELAIYHFGDHLLTDIQTDKVRSVLLAQTPPIEIDMIPAADVDIFERLTDNKNHWVIFYDRFCYVKTAVVANMPYMFQLTEQSLDFGQNEIMAAFKFDYQTKSLSKFGSADFLQRVSEQVV